MITVKLKVAENPNEKNPEQKTMMMKTKIQLKTEVQLITLAKLLKKLEVKKKDKRVTYYIRESLLERIDRIAER